MVLDPYPSVARPTQAYESSIHVKHAVIDVIVVGAIIVVLVVFLQRFYGRER